MDPLRQSPLDADQRLRNLEQSIIDLGAQSSQAIAALDQRFTTWMGQVGGTIAQIGQQVNANTQQTQAASMRCLDRQQQLAKRLKQLAKLPKQRDKQPAWREVWRNRRRQLSCQRQLWLQ